MRPNSDLPGTDPADNGDRPKTDPATDKWVTVADAAVLLGISEDAVRSRLRRRTLCREKGPDGTVFVLLQASTSDRPTPHQRPADGRRTDRRPASEPTDQEGEDTARGELLEVLRNEIAHLRDQLNQEREANRENRRIIAGLVQRVPEIEAPRNAPSQAPPEPRDASETVAEGTASGSVRSVPPEGQGQQEPVQQASPRSERSWLYRFFFGP